LPVKPEERSFAGQVNNLFDRQYYTATQLGPTGFTDQGAFIARSFPRSEWKLSSTQHSMSRARRAALGPEYD
jgi:hypothetical protein